MKIKILRKKVDDGNINRIIFDGHTGVTLFDDEMKELKEQIEQIFTETN